MTKTTFAQYLAMALEYFPSAQFILDDGDSMSLLESAASRLGREVAVDDYYALKRDTFSAYMDTLTNELIDDLASPVSTFDGVTFDYTPLRRAFDKYESIDWDRLLTDDSTTSAPDLCWNDLTAAITWAGIASELARRVERGELEPFSEWADEMVKDGGSMMLDDWLPQELCELYRHDGVACQWFD